MHVRPVEEKEDFVEMRGGNGEQERHCSKYCRDRSTRSGNRCRRWPKPRKGGGFEDQQEESCSVGVVSIEARPTESRGRKQEANPRVSSTPSCSLVHLIVSLPKRRAQNKERVTLTKIIPCSAHQKKSKEEEEEEEHCATLMRRDLVDSPIEIGHVSTFKTMA